MERGLRIARVVRLSVKEKTSEPKAMQRQIFMVNQVCTRLGGELDESLYFESIVSGRKEDREEIRQIESLIEGKKIDAIIFNRIDRLSRDVETLARIGKSLEKARIKIWECQKGDFIDLTNPNEWRYWMNAAVSAEEESRKLKTRSEQAWEYARYEARANHIVPFGYRRESDRYVFDRSPYLLPNGGEMEIWAVARRQVEILKEERGKTSRAIKRIAAELGVKWTQSGFSRWVKNEVLRGHTYYPKFKELKLNTHTDVLVSEQEWRVGTGGYASLKSLLEDAVRVRGANVKNQIYDLSGLIRCVYCDYAGNIHQFRRGKGNYLYQYVFCRSYQDGIAGKGCAGKKGYGGVTLKSVRERVIQELTSRAIALADHALGSIETESINPEILKLESQVDQLKAMIRAMGDEMGLLGQQVRLLEEKIESYKKTPGLNEADRELLIEVGSDPEFWTSLEEWKRRELFRLFIRRVVIDPVEKRVVEVELRV